MLGGETSRRNHSVICSLDVLEQELHKLLLLILFNWILSITEPVTYAGFLTMVLKTSLQYWFSHARVVDGVSNTTAVDGNIFKLILLINNICVSLR